MIAYQIKKDGSVDTFPPPKPANTTYTGSNFSRKDLSAEEFDQWINCAVEGGIYVGKKVKTGYGETLEVVGFSDKETYINYRNELCFVKMLNISRPKTTPVLYSIEEIIEYFTLHGEVK